MIEILIIDDNSIMGFASLLPDEKQIETLTNYSNIIYKNAEQLVHVIDDIVLYSQLQNKQFSYIAKAFDVLLLLDDIQKSFSLPEFQKGIELKIETFSNESYLICSDYEKVRQIFTNLISNAYKYTEKGSITFGIANKENELIKLLHGKIWVESNTNDQLGSKGSMFYFTLPQKG